MLHQIQVRNVMFGSFPKDFCTNQKIHFRELVANQAKEKKDEERRLKSETKGKEKKRDVREKFSISFVGTFIRGSIKTLLSV